MIGLSLRSLIIQAKVRILWTSDILGNQTMALRGLTEEQRVRGSMRLRALVLSRSMRNHLISVFLFEVYGFRSVNYPGKEQCRSSRLPDYITRTS
jgi:hypothetical protein